MCISVWVAYFVSCACRPERGEEASAACLRVVYGSLFKALWKIPNFDFVDTFSQFAHARKGPSHRLLYLISLFISSCFFSGEIVILFSFTT